MPTTVLALKIFLLLLPGFLSIKVSERLTLHKEKTTLQYVIDAFAFSLIIAFLYLLATSIFPNKLVPLDAITFKEKDISFGGFNAFSFFVLIALAVIVGGCHGVVAEKGWVKNLLSGGPEGKRWQLTRRSGRVNIWTTVFYEYTNSWLRVYMEDGAVIEGWCRYFSDSAEKFELLLEEVIIYREQMSDAEAFKDYKRQILLTNPKSVTMIEFLEEKNGDNHG
ncbi:MAG: DUF6338 family protein [bacterium]